ncbi:hypothetical protein Gohar_011326, partial [Gossypium harknessii]|nr:hypothetical protein [Gossypium harknessii]
MEERKKRSDLKGKEERGRVAVHSQVRKIKQESDSEQIMDWAFGIGQPEVRPVRHQLSRSPLGLTAPPLSSLGQGTLPSFLSALYKQFIVEYPVLLRRSKSNQLWKFGSEWALILMLIGFTWVTFSCGLFGINK